MSIEQAVLTLAEAINRVAVALENGRAVPTVTTAPVATPNIVAAPITAPVVAAPVVAEIPVPVAAPVAAPAAAGPCPIVDAKSLIGYVMNAYQSMGPQKGDGIKNILAEMGVSNVNEVPPASYPVLYARVEALKAA